MHGAMWWWLTHDRREKAWEAFLGAPSHVCGWAWEEYAEAHNKLSDDKMNPDFERLRNAKWRK